jgi:O-antigen/teichoic acid export membrane protein
VGTLCLLGAGHAALMSAAQRADGNLERIVRAKSLANAGGSLLLLLTAVYYLFAANSTLPITFALIVLAILFPAYNLSDIWTSWLNGRSEFGELAKGRVLIYFLPLSSVAMVAIFGITALWQVVAVYFTLVGAYNLVMLRRILVSRSNVTVDEGVLRHGRHMTAAMVFGGLTSLDVLILNHYFPAAEVAVYAVAFVLPELVRSLLVVVNQLIAPKLNNGQSLTEFWLKFKNFFLVLTASTFTLGVVGFFALPIVIPMLFSNEYVAAGSYSKWLWLATACLGSFGLLANALLATKKLVFTYSMHVGYPVLVCSLYFAFANDGPDGMIKARIIAMTTISLFYAISFYFMVRPLVSKR